MIRHFFRMLPLSDQDYTDRSRHFGRQKSSKSAAAY